MPGKLTKPGLYLTGSDIQPLRRLAQAALRYLTALLRSSFAGLVSLCALKEGAGMRQALG